MNSYFPRGHVERSPEIEGAIHQLIREYSEFNERFDDKSENLGLDKNFYQHKDLGVILQRVFHFDEYRNIILREPAVLSEADDESDEPPQNAGWLFELSRVTPNKLVPDWSVLVARNGDYKISSLSNLPDVDILDAAIKTFRAM